MRILQKPQIVPGTSGHSFLYRNARSSQYLDVTFRILVEQAIFEARSQHNVTRRGGLQKVSSSPRRSTSQCQDDHGPAQAATARQQCKVFERRKQALSSQRSNREFT
jgi:hypothetical protein